MAKGSVPPAGHSDPSPGKAARLQEIAAKVREVPGSFKEEEPNFWHWRVAFGRLIVEAYDAGAWHKKGLVIGHKLRITLTSTDRDRTYGSGNETVPAWLVEAASAVLDTLTEHMVPRDDERAEVDREAEILANEIEREAREARARRHAPPPDVPSEPLTKRGESVYRYIVSDGPVFGWQITQKTGIGQSTLTKEIIPELKRLRGIVNKPGAGYYSPAHYSPD